MPMQSRSEKTDPKGAGRAYHECCPGQICNRKTTRRPREVKTLLLLSPDHQTTTSRLSRTSCKHERHGTSDTGTSNLAKSYPAAPHSATRKPDHSIATLEKIPVKTRLSNYGVSIQPTRRRIISERSEIVADPLGCHTAVMRHDMAQLRPGWYVLIAQGKTWRSRDRRALLGWMPDIKLAVLHCENVKIMKIFNCSLSYIDIRIGPN